MLFKIERLPERCRPSVIRCACCRRYRNSKYLVNKLKWGFRFSGKVVRKVPKVIKTNFACSKRCAEALTLQML